MLHISCHPWENLCSSGLPLVIVIEPFLPSKEYYNVKSLLLPHVSLWSSWETVWNFQVERKLKTTTILENSIYMLKVLTNYHLQVWNFVKPYDFILILTIHCCICLWLRLPRWIRLMPRCIYLILHNVYMHMCTTIYGVKYTLIVCAYSLSHLLF